MRFVSLHGHSFFSTGDGHGTPEDHVLRAKELGMRAIALTEHGTVSSHAQLEKAAVEHGVKPIFGCEFYIGVEKTPTREKFHQTVLAMNDVGYRSLSKLVSRSYSRTSEGGKGFYAKPTLHPDWLLDPEQTEGLIVLSGCADSWLSCVLGGGRSVGPVLDENQIWVENLDQRVGAARSLITRFKDVFGDCFFLEVQRFPNYHKTCFINQQFEKLSEETGVPLVATADVHYPHREDWEIQRVANAIAWKTDFETLCASRDYEASICTFPESDGEIIADLTATGLSKRAAAQAVLNTGKIADRCTVVLPKTSPVRFSGSNGTDAGAKKLLLEAIRDGVNFRQNHSLFFREDFHNRREEYMARIKKELATIVPKGFCDYFLVNQQIIGWAKNNGIAVGPARGSAAGSLVCYLLRITEINPMQYPQMLFERFLDPGRPDAPDVDTDYPDDQRDQVFDYARQVYGEQNVGNIGNFTRYRGRSAVRDVGRVLKVPLSVVEEYCGFITDAPFGDPREFCTAEDAHTAFPEVQEIVKKYPGLKLAWRLEGDMKTTSVHAAGMVISNLPISDTCAVYEKEGGGETIAYDKRDAAYLNMLKLDCLGLSTMTIIADVIERVEGLTLNHLYDTDMMENKKVLRGFAKDDLVGIFQFEGRATRGVLKDIFRGRDATPDFMTLVDVCALSRPGALSSGMTAQYIKVARGGEKQLLHPIVDAILDKTNGCLVYQEQVMLIGKKFGGLSDNEIGRLRKIIGAKQAGGAFEEFWVKFRDGAMNNHGVDETLARTVWDLMAASASYLFNISHAISYTTISYWCMWLKVYYPTYFYCAALRNASKKTNKKGEVSPQLKVLKDVIKHGITVSPPHPRLSGESWEPNAEGTGVIAGYSQIDGVGPKLASLLAANPQETWEDHATNTKGFGAKAAERAKEFCSKPDPFDIGLTDSVIDSVLQAILNGLWSTQMPDATASTLPSQDGQNVTYLGHIVNIKLIDVVGEMRKRDNLTQQEVMEKLRSNHLTTRAKIVCIDRDGSEVHINVSRFLYSALKNELHTFQPGGLFAAYVTGKASCGFGPTIQADDVTLIELEK